MRLWMFVFLSLWHDMAFANQLSTRLPDPVPGLKAALQFCSQIRDDKMVAICIQLESSANWITAEALPICSMQTFDDNRISCLRGILDNQIRSDEVAVCESLAFGDQKSRCLTEIARPYPFKTKFKVDPKPGRDELSAFCTTLFFEKDKKTCLNILSSADLLTVESVRFCQVQFSDSAKLNCLEKLKNRLIVREEVAICDSVFSTSGKVNCLEGVQRKYQKVRP
jgi:hypothetical protein